MLPLQYQSFTLIFLWIQHVHGTLEFCSSGVLSKLCIVSDDYEATKPPLPAPVHVKINLTILDILEVNEDGQTIKVQLKRNLRWADSRLNVTQSPSDANKYTK